MRSLIQWPLKTRSPPRSHKFKILIYTKLVHWTPQIEKELPFFCYQVFVLFFFI